MKNLVILVHIKKIHHLNKKLEITIKRLDKLYTEKTKGRQIRSRVKWIEEGEKNTAFFLGLEKTRQTKKAMNELYDKKW